MGLKILLVHNNEKMRWADVFRCEELKKRWINDEVEIGNRLSLPDGDKYDVIHFMYSGAMTKDKDYILKYKDKVFTSLVSHRSLKSLYNNVEDLVEIYQKTHCCVCQNPMLLKEFKRITGQDNAVFIPNGVDEKLFNRPFVAGFVGEKASSEHKGLHLAQQACDELGIELLKAHNRDYDHEQMPDFYKQIDVLLIPSKSEGCHNPTLEALAMNKPVISTSTGIALYLDGVTIVDRNVESIKNALIKLSGRKQILQEYTWDVVADRYRKLYVEKHGTT